MTARLSALTVRGKLGLVSPETVTKALDPGRRGDAMADGKEVFLVGLSNLLGPRPIAARCRVFRQYLLASLPGSPVFLFFLFVCFSVAFTHGGVWVRD